MICVSCIHRTHNTNVGKGCALGYDDVNDALAECSDYADPDVRTSQVLTCDTCVWLGVRKEDNTRWCLHPDCPAFYTQIQRPNSFVCSYYSQRVLVGAPPLSVA